MVQSAEARNRNHGRGSGRFWLDWSLLRRILLQGIVNAVPLVIAHIIPDQSAQMLLIQRDDMVQNLAAAASDPSLGNAILPWRLDARRFGLQTCCLQKRDHLSIEFCGPGRR